MQDLQATDKVSPLHERVSSQSASSPLSSLDNSFDTKIEKSQLFAKLEEMTKAIDVYKEYKTK